MFPPKGKKKKKSFPPKAMNEVLGVTSVKPEPDMPMRTRAATSAASKGARMKRLEGRKI